VPIIDKNSRSTAAKEALETEARARKVAGYQLAEDTRYNERIAAERVNARLKDEFGARNVRVRGHVSMGVRYVEQALAGLLGSDMEQKGPDVSRLRHLIWKRLRRRGSPCAAEHRGYGRQRYLAECPAR